MHVFDLKTFFCFYTLQINKKNALEKKLEKKLRKTGLGHTNKASL